MKKLMVLCLCLISVNIYAHDFIWGVNLQKFITENGKPYRRNELQNINHIILSYKYATFERNYMFINNSLAGVQDMYGTFTDIDEAFEVFNMLYSRLDKIYNFVDIDEKKEQNEMRMTIRYEFGNDKISLVLVYDKNKSSINIFLSYFSPLFLKDTEDRLRNLIN